MVFKFGKRFILDKGLFEAQAQRQVGRLFLESAPLRQALDGNKAVSGTMFGPSAKYPIEVKFG